MAIIRAAVFIAALMVLTAVPAWSRPASKDYVAHRDSSRYASYDRARYDSRYDTSYLANTKDMDEAARKDLAVSIKGQSQSRYDEAMHKMNCGSDAWDYCCTVGTPCDCSAGIGASNQCGGSAYEYCCEFGTPCSC